ncbi:vWA domain-containing protein [Nafulsella turpanensis]|uniref:vWA domain-containing protein n=1 Tax=Nafulsella turpanensis TaxID=1265690 RepID=UPI0003480FC7|nr:VWA domain-containing protein [Nafulsella turpanensis]
MLKTASDSWIWLSTHWFQPETLRSFEWANPLMLYLILLIPILFLLRYLFRWRRKQRLDVALPEDQLKWSPVSLLRFVPPVVLGIALTFLCIALARPQRSNEQVEQWTEGIDIMLTMDISESMKIEDFKPNRLEAAKDVAREFIQGRFQDRIGMVVFAGEAFSLAPLTTDYQLLNEYIESLNFSMIEAGGTAIGSALAVSTNRMRESDSESKVLILLSDGENNAGSIDPITAAKLAHAYGIKIYTIAVGKEGRVPFGKDIFGNTNYIENELDETTLRKIANIGGGRFYRAANQEALEEIFAEIDRLEKAEIKETRFKDTTDFYDIYLSWAIAFFIVWIFLKGTFISNILHD